MSVVHRLLVPRDLIVRPLTGLLAGLAVTVLALALVGPPGPTPGRAAALEVPGVEPDPHAELQDPRAELALALAEVERAGQRAEDPGPLPLDAPAFPLGALQSALEGNPRLLEREQGELPALRREARWLGRVTPGGAGLGQRTWEDARLLLGFFAWYLEQAHGPGATRRWAPRPIEPSRLGELRGHEDYPGLLGAFD